MFLEVDMPADRLSGHALFIVIHFQTTPKVTNAGSGSYVASVSARTTLFPKRARDNR